MDLDKRNKLWVKIGKLFFAPLTILIAATYCNSNASLVSARMAVDRQQTDLPAQMDQKEITELNTQEIFADAPFTPNNLKVLKSSSKSIIVGWDEVNDHVEVSGYQVFVDGLLVGSTTATSFKITELKSSTWYTISIRAIDNEGNGSDEAVLLAPTYGANLLFNANFVEPGESDSLAKYWNPYVSTGTSKVIEVVNTPTGIAQKISAVSLQASGSYLGMYQLIQVEPNKPFVMSAILDIEQLSNAVVSLHADFLDVNDEVVDTKSVESSEATDNFVQVATNGRVPEGAAKVRFYFMIRSVGDNGSGTIFVKDVRLAYRNNATYLYDAANRLKSITYSDGTIINYTYDTNGNRLNSTINDI